MAHGTDLLDHVQALRSPPEAPNSRGPSVARWRSAPFSGPCRGRGGGGAVLGNRIILHRRAVINGEFGLTG
jgi:hypothetical protein